MHSKNGFNKEKALRSKIQVKLAAEREIVLAERAAAAAEKAAATAEREQAERLVRMISAAADRCNAWTGAKEASGRAMPGQSPVAPKGVVVKQPPQRPASTQSAPTNGSYPLAAPPMPSRPPPSSAAQAQGKKTALYGGRSAVVPEPKEALDAKVPQARAEPSGTGSSSAILAPKENADKEAPLREKRAACYVVILMSKEGQEAPAQDSPKRSQTSEAREEASAVPWVNESSNGTRVEPLLDDLEDEDEMDEHDLWAMNAPSPPSKALGTQGNTTRSPFDLHMLCSSMRRLKFTCGSI
eukprot:Skav208301  [mRNA]  locus=scaffold897:208791:214443:+ [translate_table: standard]